jgi:hypothetical protein
VTGPCSTTDCCLSRNSRGHATDPSYVDLSTGLISKPRNHYQTETQKGAFFPHPLPGSCTSNWTASIALSTAMAHSGSPACTVAPGSSGSLSKGVLVSDRWLALRKLGEGQFAEVWEVRDMSAGPVEDVRVRCLQSGSVSHCLRRTHHMLHCIGLACFASPYVAVCPQS